MRGLDGRRALCGDTMIITQTATAVSPSTSASFLASGGVPPYVYSVLSENSAGGSINGVSGKYSAPLVYNPDPRNAFDTIQAEDANGDTVTSQILVGPPLILFLEILQKEMSLDPERVYLYGQKKDQPKNTGPYISVGLVSTKYFGSSSRPELTADDSLNQHYLSIAQTVGVDIFSVDNSALWRKDEILLALGSPYAQRQQNANSFQIAKLPISAVALPNIDGTHIPYRFHFDFVIQYAYAKTSNIDYFDSFEESEIFINP